MGTGARGGPHGSWAAVGLGCAGLVLMLGLAACGGGGGDVADAGGSSRASFTPAPAAAAAAPQTARVAVDGCADARLHDSGQVAYVTVERGCEPKLPITLGVLEDGARHAFTFAAMGIEQAVQANAWQRRVTIVRRGSWRVFPNTESWTWRDGAGLLAKDGGLYLLGGWNSELGSTSDVWFTADAVHWTRLSAAAPWTGRHGAGWVVHADRLYVVSGDHADDVWSSADGVTWQAHTLDAPFPGRYTPNVASLNGELLLYNGMNTLDQGLGDVWRSADGTDWQPVAATPYTPRALIHGAAVFRGRIYVIGGGLKGAVPDSDWVADTTAEYRDVWSSADGRDWRLETGDMGFVPRTHFSVLGTAHGCYVANGSVGQQRATTGEVYFASDCVHFVPVSDPSPMGRVHATSMAEFNGSIVVLGGHRDSVGTSVWQYFPEDAASPSP